MIIECRKGKKAFSRLIFQPMQKAKNSFLLLYHSGRNRQISFRNLLANQRFAVEILEFRLSIVVMMKFCPQKTKKLPVRNGTNNSVVPPKLQNPKRICLSISDKGEALGSSPNAREAESAALISARTYTQTLCNEQDEYSSVNAMILYIIIGNFARGKAKFFRFSFIFLRFFS